MVFLGYFRVHGGDEVILGAWEKKMPGRPYVVAESCVGSIGILADSPAPEGIDQGAGLLLLNGYTQNPRIPGGKGDDLHLRHVSDLVKTYSPQETFRLLRGLFTAVVMKSGTLSIGVDVAWGGILYYHVLREGGLLFSNRLALLQAAHRSDPLIDQDLWSFEFPVGEKTMFKDFKRLPAGCVLQADYQGHRVFRYAEFGEGEDLRAPHASAEELEALLRASVEDCRREFQTTTISGGLDSAVLAMMLQPESAVVNTYDSYGPDFNEIHYAEDVIEACGAKTIHYVRPTPQDFVENFPAIIRAMESVVPTFSPISDFLIAREVQRKGYSSCVYGHGPDELLNGYVRHAMLHWGQEHDPAKENFFDDVACPSYAPMAEHLWGTEESRNAGMLDQYTRMVLRSETSGDEQKARVAALFHRYEHPANSLSNCELNLCYPAQMLMGTSSALTWKISGFCPYLDPRVMSFCFQAPRLKYVGNRTKWLLREVGRRIGVPSSVTERVDKKGLVVPVTQWLLGPLASWTDDLVESLARRLPGDPNVTRKLARGQFDRQLYKLVSLELWYREFVDKE